MPRKTTRKSILQMIIKIINKLRGVQNNLYSHLIKTGFEKCGKNFRLEYPTIILGSEHITIGNNFSSFSRLQLEAFSQHNGYNFSPQIIIGNNVSINYDCHIGCINKIVIGNNVLIASKVFISDHSHGRISLDSLGLPPAERMIWSKGPIIIGNNVWIGEAVSILPNVTIGDNTIVGANSVVTKSFPSNCVIAGNPARILKTFMK